MGYGKCWCGRDLVEVDFGGANAQGKGSYTEWQCPVHLLDYDKKPE